MKVRKNIQIKLLPCILSFVEGREMDAEVSHGKDRGDPVGADLAWDLYDQVWYA